MADTTFLEVFKVLSDECVRKLNSYKKSIPTGKKASLNHTIRPDLNRVSVNEGKL